MNQKKKLIILVLVFVLLIAGASVLYNRLGEDLAPEQLAVAETVPPAETTPEAPRIQAPDFTVYDQDGNEVKLSAYFGKPIVLNFWASWCGPCKMEMPDFDDKCRELEGEVVFMMVNATDGGRETVSTAKAFIDQSGYSFPVYYDTDYAANYAYGVTGLPTTFFIDAEGYLVAYGSGAMDGATLQTGIDMIWAE